MAKGSLFFRCFPDVYDSIVVAKARKTKTKKNEKADVFPPLFYIISTSFTPTHNSSRRRHSTSRTPFQHPLSSPEARKQPGLPRPRQ